MMKLKILVLYYTTTVIAATEIQSQTTNVVPEHRNEYKLGSIEEMPVEGYEYQIVPSNEYEVAEYEPEISIFDYVLSPITAVIDIGLKAVMVTKWLVINGSMIILGMAIVVGFCTFTSFCTLTINKPPIPQLPKIPYLDSIQYYFNAAYDKYQAMQNSLS